MHASRSLPTQQGSKQELPAARPGRREEITSRFTKSRADEEGWRSEKCGCGCCWNKEVRCGNCENTLKHQLKSSKKLISVMHIYISVQNLCSSCAVPVPSAKYPDRKSCKAESANKVYRARRQKLQPSLRSEFTRLPVPIFYVPVTNFFEDSIHRGAEGQT